MTMAQLLLLAAPAAAVAARPDAACRAPVFMQRHQAAHLVGRLPPTQEPSTPSLFQVPMPELTVHSFDVGATPAMQFPWTLTQSRGLTAQPRQPNNMHVAACADKAAVAWTSQEVRPYDYHNQWQQSGDTFGHVSWFSLEAGAVEMVANHEMQDCSEMGGITVSPDCSVLSVLCISREGPSHFHHLPGFKDVVSENEDQNGRVPFGWRDVHIQEPDEESANRQILHAYLFEWTLSGVPKGSPDRVSLINSAIGGWRYGSWSLVLSGDRSRYSVSLKTTLYGGGTYHEGAVRFELERDHEGEVSLVQGSHRWACGTGHVQWNVQAYNEARDAFGHWCWTDGPGPSAEWDSFAAWFADGGSAPELVSNLPKLSVDAGTNFFMTGGPTDIVSRGSAGWLGVLTSLNVPPSSTAMRLGLADLPGGNVTWLDLARPGESVGWPRLARLGSASQESDLYLLGWADVMPSQDLFPSLRPIRYNVAEVDGTGAVRAQYEVNTSAWEDVTEWATVPDTGCVVWAHAWSDRDGPLGNYGSWNQGEALDVMYSSSLRITLYCASSSQQPPPTAAPTPAPTSASAPAPAPTATCHTAVPGEECYGHAAWAHQNGIRSHPQWYPGLSPESSFEDFQRHLWGHGLGECPEPCAPAPPPATPGPSPAATPVPTAAPAPPGYSVYNTGIFCNGLLWHTFTTEPSTHTALSSVDSCAAECTNDPDCEYFLYKDALAAVSRRHCAKFHDCSSPHTYGDTGGDSITVTVYQKTTAGQTTTPAPTETCHTAVQGEECYGNVVWAHQDGIRSHPQWYPGLSLESSFEDFQEHLWTHGLYECGRPCRQ